MKTIDLKTAQRLETGKKASKQLRKQGMIPCVLYGGEKPIHFFAEINEFRHLVYTPHVYIVNIDIDGQVYKAVMKELQFHPVSDMILHIDFILVTEDKPVQIDIPVVVEGFAKGVQSGGKLKIEMRRLIVSGLAKHLPDTLKINVTKLSLGQTIKVRDLKFDNLELLDPKNSVVISVKMTRVAKGLAAAGAEEEAEGEEAESTKAEESTEE